MSVVDSPAQGETAQSWQTWQEQRARLVSHMDSAALSAFHWKATIVAGMGFLTDAYDLFVIGTVLLLIGKDPLMAKTSLFGASFAANRALIGSSALIAAFLGALLFGTIADRVGRRMIYGLELLVLATGAILSAFAPDLTWLIIVRFILGIGIGGDYPVSATIISEHANQRDRGKLISTVFAMQAAGIVAGYVAALIVLGLGVQPDIAWRILLGLGAVPALATFWLRRGIPESPRFLLNVRHDAAAATTATTRQGGAPLASAKTRARPARPAHVATKRIGSWRLLFTSPRFLLLLLGTGGAWFLMDYSYYGNTISSPIVIQHVLGGRTSAFQTTLAGFIVVVLAAVPGYLLAILTMDRLGRKTIQLLGFSVMALAFGAIAFLPGVRESIAAFALIFGLSYFFTEFGPNTTTFLYPAEVYPTVARTTGHGISAGLGKVGAFVGVLLFPLLQGPTTSGTADLKLPLAIAALSAVLGFLVTLLLPEPNQHSLEETEVSLGNQTYQAAEATAVG